MKGNEVDLEVLDINVKLLDQERKLLNERLSKLQRTKRVQKMITGNWKRRAHNVRIIQKITNGGKLKMKDIVRLKACYSTTRALFAPDDIAFKDREEELGNKIKNVKDHHRNNKVERGIKRLKREFNFVKPREEWREIKTDVVDGIHIVVKERRPEDEDDEYGDIVANYSSKPRKRHTGNDTIDSLLHRLGVA